MILEEDLCILHSDEYCKIENDFNLVERIDKGDKTIMDLKINVNQKNLYSIFCKTGKNGNKEDNSKLLFMSFLNFPDGVYLEIKDDCIICHVIELKKNPKGKIPNIGKQLMSAKYHIISLFSIMGIDLNKVEIYYYIGYVRDDEAKADEYNKKMKMKKIIPGTLQVRPQKLVDWDNDIITSKWGKYTFREQFKKIKLNFKQQIDGFDYFYEELDFI
ncbi:hypothetical protein ACQKNB_12030 [Lysinibacillus xylanilyticus]|uniref:hypothetical protein n=1 Tax=Lysinibacillus xylanilyticus TaxID=582475 RepID=UPI003D02BC5D